MNLPSARTTPGIMVNVVLALIPGLLVQVYLLGSDYLVNFVLAIVTAYTVEIMAQSLRGKAPGEAVRDASVWVTALLIVLALPAGISSGILLLAVSSGLVLGKHVYGGLGQNIFNPAMVGYAIVLVSFPGELALWSPLSSGATDGATAPFVVDALTGATTLESFKHRVGLTSAEFWQLSQAFGTFGSRAWEWVNLAYLCGGVFLIWRRIIPWQLPTVFLAALTVFAGIGYDSGSSDSLGSPALHLFSGGTMLFAFFVLTDPVTCPSNPRGRILFAMGVAGVSYLIRAFGAFPDGLAFAVLLGNLATPLLDRPGGLRPSRQENPEQAGVNGN